MKKTVMYFLSVMIIIAMIMTSISARADEVNVTVENEIPDASIDEVPGAETDAPERSSEEIPEDEETQPAEEAESESDDAETYTVEVLSDDESVTPEGEEPDAEESKQPEAEEPDAKESEQPDVEEPDAEESKQPEVEEADAEESEQPDTEESSEGLLEEEIDTYTSGNWRYRIDSSGARIIKYTGSESNVEIPEKLGGETVRSIHKEAFYNNKNITTLKIPESIESIGDEAFYGCTRINTIYFNAKRCKFDGLTGYRPFSYVGASAPELKIHFGRYVEEIPSYMFGAYYKERYCHVTEITIQSSVTKIGYGAFSYCSDLKKVICVNRNMSFSKEMFREDSFYYSNKNATFYCYRGSTADDYASDEGYNIYYLDNKVKFFDAINTNDASFDAIYWGTNKGIIAGFRDGSFRPDDNCTRAQVVLFLWRAAGKPNPRATRLPFKDAAEIEKMDPSYKKAILWGNEKGIVMGFTSPGPNQGKFKPNDPCTRGQIVTFLWRYGGKKAAKSGAKTFPDVPKTHKYYKSIMWASSYGITTGFRDGSERHGKFMPDLNCTRGQCVTFLYRMLK